MRSGDVRTVESFNISFWENFVERTGIDDTAWDEYMRMVRMLDHFPSGMAESELKNSPITIHIRSHPMNGPVVSCTLSWC